MKKESLLGADSADLERKFAQIGLTKLDAKRVLPWIHVKCVSSFDLMTDMPHKIRLLLPEYFSLERPLCRNLQKSSDGTLKALLEFPDGHQIETVFIPDEKRNTVCLSTQVGCAMGCKFCNTGRQSFVRNLSCAEIMAQVFFWKDMLPMLKELSHPHLSNLVFMGMGEPLLNAENLFQALELLLDTKKHNFSRNKITVSTSGIATNDLQQMAKFGIKLAISLHTANDAKRSELMPINGKYNIDALLNAAQEYLKRSNTEHVTFEYLLLAGINDSDADARQLAKLLSGIRCKVNLIIFNSWSGSTFSGSSRMRADAFLSLLLAKGIRTVIRKSRGSDISAACGQLKGAGEFIAPRIS
ncbi:MAG: 23S rRNA (adenine(2503)-C(2))-methyltransferase RlmN [Holosporaceae bacterium]|jgi:23S rRNA (adenine2503-C2)-methyltransferase|nr:23S rRNA (adenine(2503)-C(2))-methyltransferase RlmN [Holosporaceae bacterium]